MMQSENYLIPFKIFRIRRRGRDMEDIEKGIEGK
jgi:hypothetical protein